MISHATGSIDRAAAPRQERLKLGAHRWLSLAAAPAFAIMALATSVLGGGPTYSICSAEHGSLLSGMVPMYLLMSAFLSPPWLKLISNRCRRSHSRPVSAAYLVYQIRTALDPVLDDYHGSGGDAAFLTADRPSGMTGTVASLTGRRGC